MKRAVDTLFVAMTRPSMKWGVPFEGFVANAIITGFITFFIIRRPPGFAFGFLIHFILREICRHDPHFFWRWRLFLQTKLRSTTGAIWGGSRLQPSPSETRDAEDMRVSI